MMQHSAEIYLQGSCSLQPPTESQSPQTLRRHPREGKRGQPSPATVAENYWSAKATFALCGEDENYICLLKGSFIYSQMRAGKMTLGVL